MFLAVCFLQFLNSKFWILLFCCCYKDRAKVVDWKIRSRDPWRSTTKTGRCEINGSHLPACKPSAVPATNEGVTSWQLCKRIPFIHSICTINERGASIKDFVLQMRGTMEILLTLPQENSTCAMRRNVLFVQPWNQRSRAPKTFSWLVLLLLVLRCVPQLQHAFVCPYHTLRTFGSTSSSATCFCPTIRLSGGTAWRTGWPANGAVLYGTSSRWSLTATTRQRCVSRSSSTPELQRLWYMRPSAEAQLQ